MDGRTHRQTDAGNDNTRRPKLALGNKRERYISVVSHEPKLGSIFQRVVSDNEAFVCLAANSASGQQMHCHLSKFDVVLQNCVVDFPN